MVEMVCVCVCATMQDKVRGALPLTTSSAKFETPEPLGDWVTQRYRS